MGAYEPVREFESEIHKSLSLNNLQVLSLIKVDSLLARTYVGERRILGQAPSVRREKVLGLQWVQFPSGNWVAPAGSYRSGGGGNKTVGAFETDVSLWRCSEPTGRNARERRAGLEKSNVVADLASVCKGMGSDRVSS